MEWVLVRLSGYPCRIYDVFFDEEPLVPGVKRLQLWGRGAIPSWCCTLVATAGLIDNTIMLTFFIIWIKKCITLFPQNHSTSDYFKELASWRSVQGDLRDRSSLLDLSTCRKTVPYSKKWVFDSRYLSSRRVNWEKLEGSLNSKKFTWVLGQSKAKVFLLSLAPLGRNRYLPIRAFTIPSPPAVPGSHALTTAFEVETTSVMIMGLPATRTVTKGMFLSFSWMFAMTSLSNFSKSRLRLAL